jgi:large subunit ribosomal protein L18
MLNNIKQRNISRKRRVFRVRKNLKGTSTKPRMSVNKTNKHLFVQLIDDENSVTLAAMGTCSKEFKGAKKSKESAAALGKKIAEIAKSKKIEEVVFDRGRYKFHGLLLELAKGAREAGLKF